MINIDEQRAKEILSGFTIPAQPEILKKIRVEQEQEYPLVNVIADYIAADVGLSAHILKTINSPFYGLNRTVSDVKQAAMFLGLDPLISLISYYELKKAYQGKKSSISLERFWDSSAEMAKMCSLAIKHLNLKSDCPVEYAHTVGLFHDCGIPLMAQRFDDYRETLQTINASAGEVFTEKESKYNTNHAIVGYFVLTSWNMPKVICEFVARHHEQELILDKTTPPMMADLFCILKLVDNAHSNHRRGHDDIEWPLHKTNLLSYLGMSDEDHRDFQADLIDDFLLN